jgi:hypothetical protein
MNQTGFWMIVISLLILSTFLALISMDVIGYNVRKFTRSDTQICGNNLCEIPGENGNTCLQDCWNFYLIHTDLNGGG